MLLVGSHGGQQTQTRCACERLTSKLLLEEVHSQDAIDVTRIVAEENSTKGSKDTQKVTPHSDGRLDAVMMRGAALDGRSPAGHA
jgi:hypothetical protein